MLVSGKQITPTQIYFDDLFKNRKDGNNIQAGDVVCANDNKNADPRTGLDSYLVMGNNLDHPFPETYKGKYALMFPIATSMPKWVPQQELNRENYAFDSQLDIHA